MIVNRLLNKDFLKSSRVVGLHLTFLGADEVFVSCVTLEKSRGKINMVKQEQFHGDPGKLSQLVSIPLPICLSVEGKGIMHKKIQRIASKPVIQSAIPSAKEEDFYVEQQDTRNDTSFISFARKEVVDDILQLLISQKLTIISLTISPFITGDIHLFFPEIESSFSVGNYELSIDKQSGEIIDFNKHNDSDNLQHLYNLGGTELNRHQILPFYHALMYYTNSERTVYPSITEQKKEYTSKKLLSFVGIVSLGILFITLLGNFYFFSNYSAKKQELETQISGNKDMLSKLKQLKEDLAWREKYIGQTRQNRKKWFSYLADQIGASLPEDITLEKLEINPVSTKIRMQKEIEIKTGTIHLEGRAKGNLPINDWVLVLKKMPWVYHVEVEKFSQWEDTNMGTFAMDVQIELTE